MTYFKLSRAEKRYLIVRLTLAVLTAAIIAAGTLTASGGLSCVRP